MVLNLVLRTARNDRRLAQIANLESLLQRESDKELCKRSLWLRYRARTGENPKRLLIDAFALVREATRRTIGLRHFDVQMLGGMALCSRGLVEMQTGEGKTLTASLPLFLYALYGRGAHLSTVNDYLARRDAEWIGPAYRLLGLSVGVIESSTSPTDRHRAYGCDITYGTAKEFGFDFLRDRLLLGHHRDAGTNIVERLLGQRVQNDTESKVQRESFFMLVDEADSVLIDDATTPLIIAGTPGKASVADTSRYRWAASAIRQLSEPDHYVFQHRERRIDLTPLGRQLVRSFPQPPELSRVGWSVIYEDVERALLVALLYRRDRQYVVRDGKVEIVDEFTGRVAEGRKWRAGIHQAIEAQENLEISDDGGQAAKITVQDYFMRYRHLAGMTGTAKGTTREVRRIYKLTVATIPTNKPPIRQQLPTHISGTAEIKWHSVVDEVVALHATGRPVLIGTRSIDKSERLSSLLRAAGIEHEVLNARFEAREAEIIAMAGQLKRVTVATNMAGRGTDIQLGADVAELGGLHVIITEMHDATRIDRQLIGRCGRQGDPGSYRIFLSLDDELLSQGLGPRRAAKLQSLGRSSLRLPSRFARLFHRAQKRIERRQHQQRTRLLQYEIKRRKAGLPLGLDPYLDLPDM